MILNKGDLLRLTSEQEFQVFRNYDKIITLNEGSSVVFLGCWDIKRSYRMGYGTCLLFLDDEGRQVFKDVNRWYPDLEYYFARFPWFENVTSPERTSKKHQNEIQANLHGGLMLTPDDNVGVSR